MVFNVEQYKSWIDRRVIVVAKAENGAGVEFDGDLKMVHEKGLMIRPRGRVNFEMVRADQVERFELYDEIPKRIEPKRMAHVQFGKIREHLADRHGWALDELNGSDFTENMAYDVHEKEHAPTADKISHYHEG